MNDFQKKLQFFVTEFERAGRKVYSSEKVSRLDVDVLEDKIKRMYDFLISTDFEQIEATTTEIKEEIKPVEDIQKEIKVEEVAIEEKPAQIELVEEEKEVKAELTTEPIVEIKEEKVVIPEVKAEEQVIEKVVIEPAPAIVETPAVKEEVVEVVQAPAAVEEKKIETEPVKETVNTEVTETKVEKEEPKPAHSSVLSYLHNNIMRDGEEKPKQEATTLDLFSEKPTSIAERFENRTRSDLRTAIGVSEKFLFINDLFSGNLKEYTDFINQLNELTSWDMSKLVIEETKQRKRWASSSLAYTTLEDLIHRRFTK